MLKSHLQRYIAVGATAYIIEITTIYVLHHNLKLSSVRSIAISYWIGFVVAFIMQKVITFKNYDRSPKIITGQLAKYSLLVIWNYGFTLLLAVLFDKTLSVFIIRTGAILVTTAWNYLIYKALFKKPELN